LLSDVPVPPIAVGPQSTPNVAIPDNDATGVTDTINVTQAATITSLKVAVDITHSYRGDLRVTLTTPWGTVIELQPKGRGGSADDLKVTFDETTVPALATLRGKSTQGAWRLTVQDLAAADVGRLNRWSLDIVSAAIPAGPVDLQEQPGTAIPDFPGPAIERVLVANSTGKVGSIEVSVDVSHTWIGDLELTLVSPAGAAAVLQSRIGGDQDSIVRTFTSSNTAPLAALTGQPIAGGWRLRIADKEAQDTGKLNSWRLLIKPAL
jgi:subtilisin-like proprotein convertase family protein